MVKEGAKNWTMEIQLKYLYLYQNYCNKQSENNYKLTVWEQKQIITLKEVAIDVFCRSIYRKRLK